MIEQIESDLKKYKQEHIIEEIKKMNDMQKKSIYEQLSTIDFEQMKMLYESTKITNKEDKKITPIDYVDKEKIDMLKKQEAILIGEEIIKNDEYAVVTMAGRTRNQIRF